VLYHLLGATLSSATTDTDGVANMFTTGTKITFIEPAVSGKQTIHLSAGVAVAVDNAAKKSHTAILIPPEVHYGYGVKAVAEPDLDPSSGWGQVLSVDAMQLIAETKGSRANSIIPTEYIQKSTDDANPTVVAHKDRY